ncbi:hypothetical protein NDN01_06550 [Sphingomonas sp. QA11]|uniref:hypothetical protein n=1 Tax=Sphingomonas sp. QA11 TaxID=2950605 RepID=UPI002349248C|nr:hypothetical protein [Sphingomonas sp. QA11]WCM28577.1 hypothetical protein NDN01_06550 [Sphingomonas sp. QA11]
MQDNAPIDIPTAMLNAITSFLGQGTVDFPPFRFYFGPTGFAPAPAQRLYIPSGPEPVGGWHFLWVTPLPGYEDAVIPNGVPNEEYVTLSPLGSPCWQIHKRYLMPPGSTPPNDCFLINPTMPDANPTYALLLKKNFLDVPGFPVAAPTFDPTFSVGQETSPGIQNVSILFDGSATGDAPWNWNGSFRFLANEAYWVCTSTNSTPEGGSESVTLSVGCSTDDYQRFYDDRKITVSVDAGVIAKMFDFGVSEDMSNEMSMTVI